MDPRLALGEVAGYARTVERLGFDALHVPETVNDSFVVSALALEHSDALIVRTSVTVAFARSPMQVALSAWGLAAMSAGRFDLGLGSQIRQNIEDRYGMPWSAPVARMADYIGAVRAAWAAFATGSRLEFESESYSFRRLQPEFTPAPLTCREPDIWLGAVNHQMSELAGRAADGLITHPTNTHPVFLDEVTLPGLRGGAVSAGRPRPQLIAGAMVITAPVPELLATRMDERRQRLAFLWSTPAYEPTLQRLGHGDLGSELRELIRTDNWEAIDELVSDEVIRELCLVATYEDLPTLVADTLQGRCDGLLLRPPDHGAEDDGSFASLVAELKE